MKITKVSVVSRSGYNDNVCLVTDLPSPFLCDRGSDVKLTLHFECGRNNGIAYVKECFPDIVPEHIKVS